MTIVYPPKHSWTNPCLVSAETDPPHLISPLPRGEDERMTELLCKLDSSAWAPLCPDLRLRVVIKWAPRWPPSLAFPPFLQEELSSCVEFLLSVRLRADVDAGFVSCPLVRCHGYRVAPSHARQRSSGVCRNRVGLLGFFFLCFFVGQNFFFSPVKAKQRRLNPE